MNAFVASGLIKRRVELAGDIEKANEALRCMVQDLENLDATILQFEPDFRVEAQHANLKPSTFGAKRDRKVAASCGSSKQYRTNAAYSSSTYISNLLTYDMRKFMISLSLESCRRGSTT
jgi:hypothetical protein